MRGAAILPHVQALLPDFPDLPSLNARQTYLCPWRNSGIQVYRLESVQALNGRSALRKAWQQMIDYEQSLLGPISAALSTTATGATLRDDFNSVDDQYQGMGAARVGAVLALLWSYATLAINPPSDRVVILCAAAIVNTSLCILLIVLFTLCRGSYMRRRAGTLTTSLSMAFAEKAKLESVALIGQPGDIPAGADPAADNTGSAPSSTGPPQVGA